MEDAGGYGSLFGMAKPTKKWHKPETKKEYVNSPRTNTDWLGSSGLGGGKSPMMESSSNSNSNSNTDSPTRRSMKVDQWMGGGGENSPSRGSAARPGPIKIDGYRSSIKDNPFLKK